jgi:adenosylcobinamide kinase/adenosylcobinamide-phosphate guanylyltransferase
MGFVLIIGGARSGKSAMGQRLAEASRMPVTVIATAEPRDGDMAERIRRHREDRPHAWRTVETPVDLSAGVRAAPLGDFLLVDCLTLWVSNLLEHGRDDAAIDAAAAEVAAALAARDAVVVTNEVGLGVVPVNELARKFQDALGRVNAAFALSAERAVLMVAGRAVELAPVDVPARKP